MKWMKFSCKINFIGLTLIGLLGVGAIGYGAEDAELPVGLSLEQVLELARASSAELRAARGYSLAAQKGRDAAGLWKNPSIKFEAEGVGGDNDLYDSGEYTIALVQEIQMGGKRNKAREVALKSVEIVRQELFEIERDLDYVVRNAFLELVVLQETGKVQAELEELGRAFVEVAKRRFEMGAGSELELVQAELALEKIIFSQACCLGELVASQKNLSSLIGVSSEKLPQVIASYYELKPLDNFVMDDSHPTLRRLNTEVEKAQAEAVLAKAQDVSNLLLGAGYKYEATDDVDTFVLSLSMPLGFNKRGRTEHTAGVLRAEATLAELDAGNRRLQAELATAVELYAGAKTQSEMVRDRLIPKAEKAYELSRKGYESGRFSWLELIAAQQRLADIRITYIETLNEAHLEWIKILKLTTEEI